MRIAFYAPLKPPDHDVPSGDRRVAQLLFDALRLAGHDPFIASHVRSLDYIGRPYRQKKLASDGQKAAGRLIARWRARPKGAPALWFTYHLYYKAADWLGPAVSAALGIPYVVAEASFAPKRAGGPWDISHRAVEVALRRADRVIGLNPADREAVLPLLASPDRYVELPPFLDASGYTAPPRQPRANPQLVTVAMMRPGDKLASYRVLGAALASLLDLDWTLEVIGGGPARPEVEAALAPLGSRVRFVGEAGESGVAARLAAADLFVWPAINEAFGMAILEAQASGLAAVAGNSGGVGAVVADGKAGLLVPPGDIAAFAAAVRQLIEDPARRAAFGVAARRNVERRHDLVSAAQQLGAVLAALRSDCAA